MKVKQLLEKNTPFSVMQYYEWFKGVKNETYKQYELIYVNIDNDITFKKLNKQEVKFLKENIENFKIVINNKDGKIYEYNDFKTYSKPFIK